MAKQETPSWIENAKQEARDRENQPKIDRAYDNSRTTPMKAGGSVSSASKRADGIAQRGKTKGTMVAMCGGGYMKGKK
jgi:hypothetical protein